MLALRVETARHVVVQHDQFIAVDVLTDELEDGLLPMLPGLLVVIPVVVYQAHVDVAISLRLLTGRFLPRQQLEQCECLSAFA